MNAPSSLCPGYKQVEAFGPEEEYEDDEEVSYVVLDLSNAEPTLVPTSSTYRLIGLDTATPFLQLQGTVFKGRHDLLLGTELLFTDDKDLTKETHDRNKRSVIHVANTEQRIAFKEVTLIPKAPKEQETSKNGEGAHPINLEATPEDSSSSIDRLTGLSVPATRAPRTKKAASSTSATKAKAKAKGKGKEKAGSSKPSNAKGKGKEREVPTEDVPMDEDVPEAINIDDIYMDE